MKFGFDGRFHGLAGGELERHPDAADPMTVVSEVNSYAR